ncbi:hypothetical protein C2P56_06055 [Campylobacter jejuni]|uniref:Uncharacterized protein n=1 Tax=Campylobacter jejuni TaxID=197 RepID=A0A623THC9_CAMJU|nr:hypothetical protein [Campylobacter jejuni]EHY1189102.1 hypothetical protein [Campylobacter coli]EAH9620771.1 hypothetical protein [Campylobacter jejuni]EAI9434897.1 hypothetical protein [Campylobacter jejuni]EAJ7481805.1 hypothetical protein [Campylobacter jejuni]
MTINQKTAIRINQDFKEKYNQLWRKNCLLKENEKRLEKLKPLEEIFIKVCNTVHNLSWFFYNDLKKQDAYYSYCLKIACKVYSDGFKSEYQLKKMIKQEIKKDIEIRKQSI